MSNASYVQGKSFQNVAKIRGISFQSFLYFTSKRWPPNQTQVNKFAAHDTLPVCLKGADYQSVRKCAGRNHLGKNA